VTDQTGTFRAELLPVGLYDVTAELPAFGTQKQSNITVTVGAILTLRIELRVARVAEAVTVVATSPVLETTKTQVSDTVGEAGARRCHQRRDEVGQQPPKRRVLRVLSRQGAERHQPDQRAAGSPEVTVPLQPVRRRLRWSFAPQPRLHLRQRRRAAQHAP